MTTLEAFRARYAQYLIHRALLGIDELNFYRQELDLGALSPEERRFMDDSRDAHERDETEAWRTLEESGKSLEAAERLNAELGDAKRVVEKQRDELQTAYATLAEQTQALEEQNRELVATKENLEQAKLKADQDLEDTIERLRLQQHLGLMVDRLRSQAELLQRQNWLGPMVVAGTGLLFWVTGEQIVAGAFVTLASMYLQTVAGGFSSFFGSSRDGHQEADKSGRR